MPEGKTRRDKGTNNAFPLQRQGVSPFMRYMDCGSTPYVVAGEKNEILVKPKFFSIFCVSEYARENIRCVMRLVLSKQSSEL